MKKQEALLQELISIKQPKQQNLPTSRWKSSDVIDRDRYGKFILHFADQFLADTSSREIEGGEIVLLLWIMLYIFAEEIHRRSTSEKATKNVFQSNYRQSRRSIQASL